MRDESRPDRIGGDGTGTKDRDRVARVCRVVDEARGRSLRDTVRDIGWRELRSSVTRQQLVDYLVKHPKLVFDWLRYSQDKRTSDGWYLIQQSREWVVGRLGGGEGERDVRFGAGPDACAEFILRELDSVTGDGPGTATAG